MSKTNKVNTFFFSLKLEKFYLTLFLGRLAIYTHETVQYFFNLYLITALGLKRLSEFCQDVLQ